MRQVVNWDGSPGLNEIDAMIGRADAYIQRCDLNVVLRDPKQVGETKHQKRARAMVQVVDRLRSQRAAMTDRGA